MLPRVILGGLGQALIAAAGIAAFWLALSWAWRTTTDLATLPNDPDRERHAAADLLIERNYCVLWLCL